MSNQYPDPYGAPQPPATQRPSGPAAIGFLRDILRELRLVWRLMRDPRVPLYLKLIPPVALAYIVSPLDFIPDVMIGLGQLDDLGIAVLSIKAFVELSPPAVVYEHRMALDAEAGVIPPAAATGQGPVVSGSWTVIDPSDPNAPKP